MTITTVDDMKKHLEEHQVLNDMRTKLFTNVYRKYGKEELNNLRYGYLEQIIIEACFNARQYKGNFANTKVDSLSRRRNRDIEAIGQLTGQAKALEKIIKFISDYPSIAGHALMGCHDVPDISINFDRKMLLSDAWIKIFTAYKDALNEEKLPVKKPIFIHSTAVGALDFGSQINLKQGNKIKAASTSLLFLLAFYFRRYTSGVDTDFIAYMQTAEPMPKYGKPCYELCASLIAAALDEEISTSADLSRRLTKLIAKYPKLGFVGWPEN